MRARSIDKFRGLGKWSGRDEFLATAMKHSGEGADTDLPPSARLGRSITRLAMARMSRSDKGMLNDAISVFVLSPALPDGPSMRREPLLMDGHIDTGGHVWLTNQVGGSGRGIAVDDATSDGAYFEKLEELGLSRLPTVVFNPKATPALVSIYEKGIDQEDEPDRFEIESDREITSQAIVAIIRKMVEWALATPGVQPTGTSVWADADQHWAAKNAESMVQKSTQCALLGGLLDCDVRVEQTSPLGRTDIEIVQRIVDDEPRPVAQMEIKVTREYGSTGKRYDDIKNKEWLESGVKQAAGYRRDRGGRAILYFFDMRKVDIGDTAAIACIEAAMDEHSVEAYRSFIHNSATSARDAAFPAATC